MIKSRISGIIPPVITPLSSELELDGSSLNNLVNFVIDNDVHGIFALGTNGECASLSRDVKLDTIKRTVDSVAGRIPVFVNITTSSFKETSSLAEYASDKGADYVVVAPPFYFEMNQVEIFSYFKMIADNSRLPLLLYNAPQYTKTVIEPDTAARLSGHPNIVGLKDSSGSMFYLHQLLARIPNDSFSVLVGTEVFLGESILLGIDGGVNGGANMFPVLYVSMYNAAVNGDLNEMKKLQSRIQKVQNKIYDALDSPMSIVIGLKYMLSLRGICSSRMAMPVYEEPDEEYKRNLAALLEEYESFGL